MKYDRSLDASCEWMDSQGWGLSMSCRKTVAHGSSQVVES